MYITIFRGLQTLIVTWVTISLYYNAVKWFVKRHSTMGDILNKLRHSIGDLKTLRQKVKKYLWCIMNTSFVLKSEVNWRNHYTVIKLEHNIKFLKIKKIKYYNDLNEFWTSIWKAILWELIIQEKKYSRYMFIAISNKKLLVLAVAVHLVWCNSVTLRMLNYHSFSLSSLKWRGSNCPVFITL